jgi:hypothetical protein
MFVFVMQRHIAVPNYDPHFRSSFLNRTPTPLPLFWDKFHFLLRSGWRKPPLFRSKRLLNPSFNGIRCFLPALCSHRSYLVIHGCGEFPSADFDALRAVFPTHAVKHLEESGLVAGHSTNDPKNESYSRRYLSFHFIPIRPDSSRRAKKR